jgi:hypothetical protein
VKASGPTNSLCPIFTRISALGPLGLIRFCGIPLDHIVIYDKDMFRELAEEGKLTPLMFAHLKEYAFPYNWNYYDVEEVHLVKKGTRTFLEVDYWKFPLLRAMQK